MKKEIKQLHDMGVIKPIHPTPEQKRSALQYLMFLKEKRSGAIKVEDARMDDPRGRQ